MDDRLLVEMNGIVKRFGDTVANDRVDFEVRAGEVHALLGENGAGKTTLMKVLYGLYRPDAGSIRIRGEPAVLDAPADAIEWGIGMVTQHFSLVPTMTVAENVILGRGRGIQYDQNRTADAVRERMQQFGLRLNPTEHVGELSVGEKQRVEIVKALYRNCEVLILDEPTAVLPPPQIDELFSIIGTLVERGVSVVFISHKLNEVLRISDRITVLRDGRVAGNLDCRDATPDRLARLMVGREVVHVSRAREANQPGETDEVLLEAEDLCVSDREGTALLNQVTLTVHEGEILGLAGVSGNGQSTLVDILCGVRKPDSGRVVLLGQDHTGSEPDTLRRAGMGRIPEDRHRAVVDELTVAENIGLEELDRFTDWKGNLDTEALGTYAQSLIDRFEIKASVQSRAGDLSGGNLQKVILARTLSRQPRVIIASQPTRGLDVGSIEYVHSQLLKQRREGTGLLLVSEELDELMDLSDRIAVIYEGEILTVIPAEEADEERLGLLMGGSRETVQHA